MKHVTWGLKQHGVVVYFFCFVFFPNTLFTLVSNIDKLKKVQCSLLIGKDIFLNLLVFTYVWFNSFSQG
jgi:hypothetical protein